jgi:hypothetical protein
MIKTRRETEPQNGAVDRNLNVYYSLKPECRATTPHVMLL